MHVSIIAFCKFRIVMRCSKFNTTLLLQCCFNNVLHLPPFAPHCWTLRPQCRAVASMIGYAHTPAISPICPYALRYGATWYHTTHNSAKRRIALREHWPTLGGSNAGQCWAMLGSVGQPAPDVGRERRRAMLGSVANSAARIAGNAGSVGQPAPDIGATFRALKYE